MINLKVFKVSVLMIIAAALIACGGSGNTTQTGVFIDAVVSGLDYKASPSGLSGTTNENGEFNYENGDIVSFKLGDIDLGSSAPDSDKEVKVTALKNYILVGQLLQTLDHDTSDDRISVADIVIPEDIQKSINDKLASDSPEGDILDDSQLATIRHENADKPVIGENGVLTKEEVQAHIDEHIVTGVTAPVSNLPKKFSITYTTQSVEIGQTIHAGNTVSMSCGVPSNVGEEETYTETVDLDSETYAFQEEEIFAKEVVSNQSLVTFYSGGSFSSHGIYDPGSKTITGEFTEISTTSWSIDSRTVSCKSIGTFIGEAIE